MLKGLGQISDMAKLMKNASELQSRMAEVQQNLAHIEVTGEAGGGLVTVTVTAQGLIRGVLIDEMLLTPAKKNDLENLVASAMQDAQMRAGETARQEMAKATEGLDLPESMKLPGA